GAMTAGRREEFAAFSAFADPTSRATIPDPQDRRTFESSRLRWDEREEKPHDGVLRLYAALLQTRRELAAFSGHTIEVKALDDDTVMMIRVSREGTSTALVVRLRGQGSVVLPDSHGTRGAWRTMFTTEDSEFVDDGCP